MNEPVLLFFLEDGNNDHTESVYPCPYPLFCRRCPDSSLIQREFNEQMWQAGPHRLYICLGKTSALASPPRLKLHPLLLNNAQRTRTQRYQSTTRCCRQRNRSKGISHGSEERNAFTSSSSSRSAPVEHFWTLHSTDNRQKPLP